jgi:hypothetical protein
VSAHERAWPFREFSESAPFRAEFAISQQLTGLIRIIVVLRATRVRHVREPSLKPGVGGVSP